MKVSALCIIALLLSFETFAYGDANIPAGNVDQPMIMGNNSYYGIQGDNVKPVSWTETRPSVIAEDDAASEQQEEFGLGLMVYSLIILVYSLYWQKNNKLAD